MTRITLGLITLICAAQLGTLLARNALGQMPGMDAVLTVGTLAILALAVYVLVQL